MTRTQYDCIGVNARYMHSLFPNAEMVAWYGTGDANVRWLPSDNALWPNAVQVQIDQGFTGSPIPGATVRDVERGAWTLSTAMNRSNWTAERQTIYCNRSTLPQVAGEGWQGDVWLAAPSTTIDQVTSYPGINIVAIQDTFNANFDSSTVYDGTWPYLASEEKDMIYVSIDSGVQKFIPIPEGTCKGVLIYNQYMPANVKAEIRVEMHSLTKGWTVDIQDYPGPEPFTLTFPHPDINAVTIHNLSAIDGMGFTLY